MPALAIEIGYDVFLSDGADSFGAVRAVNEREIVVNVENGGDFRVPASAIRKIASKRVVVDWDALDPTMRAAIARAQEREDFPPPDEGEVELVPPPATPDEEDASLTPPEEPLPRGA